MSHQVAAAERPELASTAWNASAGSGGLIRSPCASSHPSSCRRQLLGALDALGCDFEIQTVPEIDHRAHDRLVLAVEPGRWTKL